MRRGGLPANGGARDAAAASQRAGAQEVGTGQVGTGPVGTGQAITGPVILGQAAAQQPKPQQTAPPQTGAQQTDARRAEAQGARAGQRPAAEAAAPIKVGGSRGGMVSPLSCRRGAVADARRSAEAAVGLFGAGGSQQGPAFIGEVHGPKCALPTGPEPPVRVTEEAPVAREREGGVAGFGEAIGPGHDRRP